MNEAACTKIKASCSHSCSWYLPSASNYFHGDIQLTQDVRLMLSCQTAAGKLLMLHNNIIHTKQDLLLSDDFASESEKLSSTRELTQYAT